MRNAATSGGSSLDRSSSGAPIMNSTVRPLAVVTGGSSGIGLELARECLANGFDVVIAADQNVDSAVSELGQSGGRIETVECDLATKSGVEKLWQALAGREPDALLANAGHGL